VSLGHGGVPHLDDRFLGHGVSINRKVGGGRP
jgi:hypothetical protein